MFYYIKVNNNRIHKLVCWSPTLTEIFHLDSALLKTFIVDGGLQSEGYRTYSLATSTQYKFILRFINVDVDTSAYLSGCS